MSQSNNERLRKELERRHTAIKAPMKSRRPHWKAVGELVQPRTGRFDETRLRTDREGDMNEKIINSTGTLAHRIAKSGMHTGLTSHTSPWFSRRFRNDEINDWGPAKIWLEEQVRRVYVAFERSTFYNLCPRYYGDAILFGVGAMHMDAHPDGGILTTVHPIGTYAIADDRAGHVDTIYIENDRTVRTLVDEYGLEGVSRRTKNSYENGNTEKTIRVVTAIEPNDERVPMLRDFRGMPYRSVKWEDGSEADELLEVSGYREFPDFVTVWNKDTDDPWGGGPAFEALPDLRMLQKLESQKLEQLDKVGDPAVNAPASMRGDGVTLNPGETNWVNDAGSPGVTPVLKLNPDINAIEASILKTEARVMQHFFANLFEAINMSATPGNRRDRTAREVEELHREKLIQLIPALESFFRSFLAPAVDRCWNILERQDLLDPPPPGLEIEELKTEFTSTLALAQRAVENNAIDQGLDWVAGAMQIDPTVVDRVNIDGLATTYFDNIGMPAKGVHSDDEVAATRANRQQSQQDAAAMEQAERGAKTAKDMSQAEPTESNVLGQMAETFGGQLQ